MPLPLPELRILGPTSLRRERDGETLAALPPKRLALLAYLAVATLDGWRRRDHLIGLIWPELEQEAARSQLRKGLFHLRRILGPRAVLSRGNEEVRIDAERLWCDATALPLLVKDARFSEGLDVYRGELLEGLFPEGVAPEFQEWLDDQRRQLRKLAAQAAWHCAQSEEDAGDRRAAAVLARRAMELTPDDEDGVRRLMSLLDRLGDRGSALRVYADWQLRLRREYGVEPAPETRKLARRVQADRKGESHDTPATQSPVSGAEPGSVDAAAPINGSANAAPPASRTSSRWRFAAAVVVLVTIGAAALRSFPSHPADGRRASIAVLPVRQIGDTLDAAEGERFTDELSTALANEPDLIVRTAFVGRRPADVLGDPYQVGRRLGVAFLVDGRLQTGKSRVRITLRVVRTSDRVVTWASTFDSDATDPMTAVQAIAVDASKQIHEHVSSAKQPPD